MERLTEKSVGCFEYDLKNHKVVPGEFGTYDAFFDYSTAVKRLGHYEDTGLEPEEIPHWIPVKERLPDKPQDCLCLFDDGSMGICWSNGAPYTFGNGAIYWMPLPQPQKGEK